MGGPPGPRHASIDSGSQGRLAYATQFSRRHFCGMLHILIAVVRREYNPGLWTSLGVFLPFGVTSYAVLAGAGATAAEQLLAGSIAVTLHVAIILHVRRCVTALKSLAVMA